MTASEKMTKAFKMMLDPSYPEKTSGERTRIREAAKGMIASAEKKVKMDRESWQAGYNAGRRRDSSMPPENVEALSWHSGYIEGKATPPIIDQDERES